MSDQMVIADSSVESKVNEAAVVVVAAAFVLGLASVALAAIAICGWKGAKRVDFDWLKMRATFYCR